MFFALSGFLITGSGMRLSIRNFLLNRGMRIVPALAVDVFVCALIIGPFVTTVALSQYFRSGDFYSYFFNIVGFIHYKLPGVFEYYPHAKVNGSLWTVPYEIMCYAFISVFIVTRWLHSFRKVLAFTFIYYAIGFVIDASGLHIGHGIDNALRIMFTSEGSRIITAFLIGIMLFQLMGRIPYNPLICLLATAAFLLPPLLLPKLLVSGFLFRPILLPLICYVTIWLGLTAIWIPNFFRRGDYSYGIYLYHYPFIHLLNTSALATVAMSNPVRGVVTYMIVVPIILTVAFLSWHLIEKPTLAQRKKFSFIARERGIETAAKPVSIEQAPVAPNVGDAASPANA